MRDSNSEFRLLQVTLPMIAMPPFGSLGAAPREEVTAALVSAYGAGVDMSRPPKT